MNELDSLDNNTKIPGDDLFDQYDDETWEDDYEEDLDEEKLEPTKKTKVSTNPK